MEPLKTAVIGVGYLGRFHAQKFSKLEDSNLLGVIDNDLKRAEEVGKELGVPWFESLEAMTVQPDAVSIAVPTIYHFETGKKCLEKGIHVLMEKPFASNLEQSEALLDLSVQKNLCLQIGHLERFNPVFEEFQKSMEDEVTSESSKENLSPQFIECIRIAPFPKRGTDVDVILDLMIHDIDLIQSLLKSIPESVEANGVSILTPTTDIANARLRFANGCVVNLTASRVSDKAERKMRIFQRGAYHSLDFGTGQARRVKVDLNKPVSQEMLQPEEIMLDKGDALNSEIAAFLKSIRSGEKPRVSAEDGLAAMRIAWQIKDQLQQQ